MVVVMVVVVVFFFFFFFLFISLQKPSPKSKTRDHQNVLSNRLALWKEGKIDKLLREGRIIQGRIGKLKRVGPPDRSKVFAKLVLEGQINLALRFLSESSSSGVLALTDEVMTQTWDHYSMARSRFQNPCTQISTAIWSGKLLCGRRDPEFHLELMQMDLE